MWGVWDIRDSNVIDLIELNGNVFLASGESWQISAGVHGAVPARN